MESVGIKSKRRGPLGLVLLLLAVLLVSACGPIHMDPRWSSISTVGSGQILLAFGDRLALVEAEDGDPVPLRDGSGNIRLDDEGNARVWEVLGTGNGQTRFYNTPIMLDAETMLAPSYDNQLLKIDVPVARVQGSGTALDQHIVSSPVVGDEFIYQGLGDRDLVALRADDLTEAWRVTTGHGIWAQPLLVEDTLYFTSMDHFLYAVDAQTGAVRWQTDLLGALTSTPTYADGHLYVGSFAKRLFDVSAETGEILAEIETNDWIWSGPALADGVLYVGDVGGTVYAVDTANGLTSLWTNRVSERTIPATPLVTESVVIVGSRDQNVYWLDRETGAVLDTKATAGEVMTEPVLVEPSETNNVREPLVVVSTTAAQELLVAFTLERGQRVWAYGR